MFYNHRSSIILVLLLVLSCTIILCEEEQLKPRRQIELLPISEFLIYCSVLNLKDWRDEIIRLKGMRELTNDITVIHSYGEIVDRLIISVDACNDRMAKIRLLGTTSTDSVVQLNYDFNKY